MSNHRFTTAADSIAATIAERGMTKQTLSDLSGVPYSSLNRKLAGHTDFTFVELFDIAVALNVEPYSLLPREFKASRVAA